MSKVHKYLTEYNCNRCHSNTQQRAHENDMFFSQAVLDAHVEDVHNKTNLQRNDVYKCDHCKNAKFAIFQCKDSSAMVDHVLTCHAYGCAECPKHFSTTAGLKYHYKKAHLIGEVFTCNRCGKGFSNVTEMKSHQLEKHGSKRTSYGSHSNIHSENDTRVDYGKPSVTDVDTGDEAQSTTNSSNIISATINSEDKGKINDGCISYTLTDILFVS